jgi:hypothetical protein
MSQLSLSVVAPPVTGRVTRARTDACEALAAVIWDAHGRRRLPSEASLAAAMAACKKGDVWWACEAGRHGPAYFLPTIEWVALFAAQLDAWGAKSVLEVGAGDGFLSACLRQARPKLKIIATDNHAWTKANARSENSGEFADVAFAGIVPHDVDRMAASTAVRTLKPDVVICSWAPPGLMVERCIRGPSKIVVDISVDGDVCGNGMRTWRFNKEFLDGPLEDRALCRLDDGGAVRATRITAYYGMRHKQHGLESS